MKSKTPDVRTTSPIRVLMSVGIILMLTLFVLILVLMAAAAIRNELDPNPFKVDGSTVVSTNTISQVEDVVGTTAEIVRPMIVEKVSYGMAPLSSTNRPEFVTPEQVREMQAMARKRQAVAQLEASNTSNDQKYRPPSNMTAGESVK